MAESSKGNTSPQHAEESLVNSPALNSANDYNNHQATPTEDGQAPGPVEAAPQKPDEMQQKTNDDIVPSEIMPTAMLVDSALHPHGPHKISLVAIDPDVPPQPITSTENPEKHPNLQSTIPAHEAQQTRSAQPSSSAAQNEAQHEETIPSTRTPTPAHLELSVLHHGEEKDGEHHREPEKLETEKPETEEKSKESKKSKEEEDDDDEESTLSFIQKRRFTFKDMSRPQRLISGLAIGQLLASALLLILNLLPLALIHIITTSDNGAIGLPVYVLVAADIFYILSWSFLLSGALHGHILMRILVLGAFSYVLLQTPIFGIVVAARIGLLAILLGWGLVISLMELREFIQGRGKNLTAHDPLEQPTAQPPQGILARPDWGLYLPTFLPVLAALVIYHTLLLGSFFWLQMTVGGVSDGTPSLPYAVIELNMRSLTLLLIPALFLAGTDFAELGVAISRSAGAFVSKFRTRTPWPLALATSFLAIVIIVVSVAIIVNSALIHKPVAENWLADLFLQLAIGASILAVLGGIFYLAGVQRWPALAVKPSDLHIKTRLLVLATLLTVVISIYVPGVVTVWKNYTQQPSAATETLPYTTYQQSQVQPNFSIAYPLRWIADATKNNAALTIVGFVDPGTSPPGSFFVVRYPQGSASFQTDLSQFLASVCNPTCTISSQKVATDGAWQVLPFVGDGQKGSAWMQDINGQRWLLFGVTTQKNYNQAFPLYTTAVHSWRADLNAVLPNVKPDLTKTINDAVNQVSAVLLVVLPLLAALLLAAPFLLRRRTRPDIFAVGALFFLVLGLVNIAYRVPYFVEALAPRAQFEFNLPGVLLTVSVATVIVVCWLFLKHQVREENRGLLSLLLLLNGGLGFVALMYWIYGLALGSRGIDNIKVVAFLQAGLLIVALGWDIFTSGENTNKGGPHSPRHARLLLFLGYIMLVATAVLYFSSQVTYPGSKQLLELFFESENWPQQGIFYLGVPLVITTFILKASDWWGSRRAPVAGESALAESVSLHQEK